MNGTTTRLSDAAAPRASVLALAVFAVAIVVMAGSLSGPFLYDDVALIEGNSSVHSWEHAKQWFTGSLWDTNFEPSEARRGRGFWRPVVLMSYAINWQLSQDPIGFHALNLLLHGLNSALVFFTLRRWTRRVWGALAGALVFAVHPVQAETAAWISARTDSLCLLGMLVSILGFNARLRDKRLGVLLELLGVSMAFGSKEAALVLPVFIGIELLAYEKWPRMDRRWLGRSLRRVWPYLALCAGYFAAHRILVDSHARPLGLDALNAVPLFFEAWGRYAKLILWPVDLTLGSAKVTFSEGRVVPNYAYAGFGALALIAVAFAAWRSRTNHRGLSVALIAYAAILLPLCNLVWLGYFVLTAPRFLYIPMLSLALVCACGVGMLPRRRFTAALVGGILTLWAAVAFARASDFGSELRFWRRELEANPRDSAAQEYFITRELNAGRPQAALGLARSSLALATQWQEPAHLVASMSLRVLDAVLAVTPDLKRKRLERTLHFLRLASRGQPARLSLPNLGVQLNVQGKSLSAAFSNDRLRLLTMQADVASRLGLDDEAIEAASAVVADCPNCWTLLPKIAQVQARARRLDVALRLGRRAHEFSPSGQVELLRALGAARAWHERLEQSPRSILANVGFYSALGAFGRAYAAARPLLVDPPRDPSAIRSLAELCYRAGDADAARRLLLFMFRGARLDGEITRLSALAPWQDKPRGPDDWLPSP